VFLRSGEETVGQEGRGWRPTIPFRSPASAHVHSGTPAPSLLSHRAQGGFTLIELIVVIVILGILAAIAVPALTGYIEKSADKKWEVLARDYNVACRAVLDEAYANGELDSPTAQGYLDNPYNSATPLKLKFVGFRNLSQAATGDSYDFDRRLSDLLGYEYDSDYWYLDLAACSGTSLLNDDAYCLLYCPDGWSSGNPVVYITYKISPLKLDANTNSDFGAKLYSAATTYDPDAGYQVYHVDL
jgi:prepilin-type N-terminal cleavage/methylation domain-containing protein